MDTTKLDDITPYFTLLDNDTRYKHIAINELILTPPMSLLNSINEYLYSIKKYNNNIITFKLTQSFINNLYNYIKIRKNEIETQIQFIEDQKDLKKYTNNKIEARKKEIEIQNQLKQQNKKLGIKKFVGNIINRPGNLTDEQYIIFANDKKILLYNDFENQYSVLIEYIVNVQEKSVYFDDFLNPNSNKYNEYVQSVLSNLDNHGVINALKHVL